MSTDPGDFVALAGGAICVVTTCAGDERSGCLVGFAGQVSIDPPRFLVALSEANHTYGVARRASVLAVHLLAADADELAALFGSRTGDRIDKFTRCRWSPGPDGVPLLDDAIAVLVGRVVQRLPFGDHVGHLLEPVTVTVRRETEPYQLGRAMRMEPGHAAEEA